MEPPDYIDLNRAFVTYDADEPEQDLQSIELADQLGSDQRLRWRDLEQSSRVVILGEARSGKSEELKRQAERLREIGHLAFTMTVEDLHDHGLQVAMMDKGDDGLARWRGQGGLAPHPQRQEHLGAWPTKTGAARQLGEHADPKALRRISEALDRGLAEYVLLDGEPLRVAGLGGLVTGALASHDQALRLARWLPGG